MQTFLRSEGQEQQEKENAEVKREQNQRNCQAQVLCFYVHTRQLREETVGIQFFFLTLYFYK